MQSDRQIQTYVGRMQHLWMFSYVFHTNKDMPSSALGMYEIQYSSLFCLKGLPWWYDDTVCSREFVEHRAPEVPGPRRLLCRQPKAYLQADTSHAGVSLELLYIIMSSVTAGTETSKRWKSQRSAAFFLKKPQHIALQRWECETVLYLLEVCVVPQRQVE